MYLPSVLLLLLLLGLALTCLAGLLEDLWPLRQQPLPSQRHIFAVSLKRRP